MTNSEDRSSDVDRNRRRISIDTFKETFLFKTEERSSESLRRVTTQILIVVRLSLFLFWIRYPYSRRVSQSPRVANSEERFSDVDHHRLKISIVSFRRCRSNRKTGSKTLRYPSVASFFSKSRDSRTASEFKSLVMQRCGYPYGDSLYESLVTEWQNRNST